MSVGKREILSLPLRNRNPPEAALSETRVELGTIDALLPCRNFEVAYKVAELGVVSPTLEFLLRLVKAVPGIDESDVGQFFGYTLTDLTYVLNEALEPGYIERSGGRVWLTTAGEGLFRNDSDEPKIFSVEERRRVLGFDMMSVAPQPSRRLDEVELSLPELTVRDGAAVGTVGERIPDRFRYFFRQLSERSEKTKSNDADLYSIDRITPLGRFSMPVRIRVHATLEDPNSAEIDLSAWRDAHEVADRREVESAAGTLLKKYETTTTAAEAFSAYELLLEFAPDFLREYSTRNGLSVRRFWREAAARVGEARSDRKTIPIVGALHLQENVQRLLSVLEYGMRDSVTVPSRVLVVAPQGGHWGATTELRDLLTVLKSKLRGTDLEEPRAICMVAGRPSRLIERTFDETLSCDMPPFPRSLEILLVPGTMCAVVVHSPIGDAGGYPVPLGFASFDPDIVQVVTDHVEHRSNHYRLRDTR